MDQNKVSNPNDFKVVSFHNSEDFGFTPEMGCMFDGRGIYGSTGAPGINAGETITLPYHIAHRLATNLAKVAMTRRAPNVDPAGIPTGVPLWDVVKLDALKNSYLTDLYSEQKPVAMTETDKLMAKVEEYKKLVENFVGDKTPTTPTADATQSSVVTQIANPNGSAYQDKAEVIAELEKRDIQHDKRQSKATLEKLLV